MLPEAIWQMIIFAAITERPGNGLPGQIQAGPALGRANPIQYQDVMKKKLAAAEREQLLAILKLRFEKNMNRHAGIPWQQVSVRFTSPQNLPSDSAAFLLPSLALSNNNHITH